MAGARTRSLAVGPTGFAIYGERGAWLEVLDGGTYGWKNTLSLTNRDLDDAVTGEQDVPCIAGTVIVADFDQVTLRIAAAAADTVVVRVGDGDPPPALTGKPRVHWLARGIDQSIAGTTSLKVLDFSAAPVDQFLAAEHHEFCDWIGWVHGTKSFATWSTVRADPTVPTTELLAQSFLTRTLTPPVGTVGTSGFACFLELGAANTTTRGTFLPNTSALQVVNTDALAGTFSWLIGVRG